MDAALLDLLERHTGLRPDKLTPEKTLLDDLGIDGDDAVELFAAFEEMFGGDLQPLYDHWSQHFGPEGIRLDGGLRLLTIGIPIALATIFGAVWAGWPDWAAMLCCIVALGVWAGPLRSWPWPALPDPVPIRIQDLVDMIESGRWPMTYTA